MAERIVSHYNAVGIIQSNLNRVWRAIGLIEGAAVVACGTHLINEALSYGGLCALQNTLRTVHAIVQAIGNAIVQAIAHVIV